LTLARLSPFGRSRPHSEWAEMNQNAPRRRPSTRIHRDAGRDLRVRRALSTKGGSAQTLQSKEMGEGEGLRISRQRINGVCSGWGSRKGRQMHFLPARQSCAFARPTPERERAACGEDHINLHYKFGSPSTSSSSAYSQRSLSRERERRSVRV